MSKYSIKEPLRYSLTYLIAAGLCVTSLYPITALADEQEMMCHAVADNDKLGNDSLDMLVKIYADGTVKEIGTGTGTKHMEAISFDISGKTLYVVAEPAEDGSSNGSRFGTLDLDENSPTRGQFIPIGNGLGTANGAEGPILIDDVDSLTFDYASQGIIYATLRREHTNPPQYDLLFRIDPFTGQLVSNTFGTGLDYVPVIITNKEDCPIDDDSRAQDDYYDVDDIASDPQDGTLYAVVNTGNGVESVLAELLIDKEKGVPTGEAICLGSNTDDIESLDFEKIPQPDGSYRLYGTTGNGGHRKSDDSTAKNHIYLIDKVTGASSQLGKLQKQPLQPNQDYEAVSCQPVDNCLMYALHDEGLNDSQVVTIDPFAGNGIGAIGPIGPLYMQYDIEGLAILPSDDGDTSTLSGTLYGTSGSDQGCRKTILLDDAGEPVLNDKGKPKKTCEKDAEGNKVFIPDGALYKINRETGLIEFIGLTGFSEVSGFALRATDNTLWGWARGGSKESKGAKSKVGPLIIDPDTGKGELQQEFEFFNPDIQAIAWSNDGQTLYGAEITDDGSDLWAYDYTSKELSIVCENTVPAEIEAMEIQPNNLLLLGTHSNKDIGMVAYDPDKCEVVATRTFKDVPEYYDIESIEWPAAECGDRSWLYATSGDAEIQLIEYDIVPDDVVDAVCLALKCDQDDNIEVEKDGETVKVYVGEQVFVARPAIYGGSTRQGMREENGYFIVETASGEKYELRPIAGDEEALKEAVPDIEIVDNVITVGTMECKLDILQEPAEVEEGEPKQRVEFDLQVVDQQCFGEDDNRLPAYQATWPNGSQQLCCLQ